MTSQEMIDSFWTHYIMLEKEFMSTISYVKLDLENYYIFSDVYAKLILQIGSEVDVVAKEACTLIDPAFSGDTMDKYRVTLSSDVDFINTKVELINYNIILNPWSDYETTSQGTPAIIWWKAYNKVKHERTNSVTINGQTKDGYKFANLINVLNALAGLYVLLLHSYYLLLNNENKKLEVPLPGSRLFKLIGTLWSNVAFPFDIILEIDDGCLIMKTSTIQY